MDNVGDSRRHPGNNATIYAAAAALQYSSGRTALQSSPGSTALPSSSGSTALPSSSGSTALPSSSGSTALQSSSGSTALQSSGSIRASKAEVHMPHGSTGKRSGTEAAEPGVVKFECQLYKKKDDKYLVDIQRLSGDLLLYMDILGQITAELRFQ
eukprot:gene31350-6506_t